MPTARPCWATRRPSCSDSDQQLASAAPCGPARLRGLSSLALRAVLAFSQTVRHRDYFVPPDGASDEAIHAAPPTGRVGPHCRLGCIGFFALIRLRVLRTLRREVVA